MQSNYFFGNSARNPPEIYLRTSNPATGRQVHLENKNQNSFPFFPIYSGFLCKFAMIHTFVKLNPYPIINGRR
jgi:hypothetical protein